jgi:hypothetical protein
MYMVSGKYKMYEASNGFAPAETTEAYSDLVAGASADTPSQAQ